MAGSDLLQRGDWEYCYRLPDLENHNREDRQRRIDRGTRELRYQMRYRCVADLDLDRIHNRLHSHDHSIADRRHAGLRWEGLATVLAIGWRKAQSGLGGAAAAD